MSNNLCSIALPTIKSKMAILAKPLIILGAIGWILTSYISQPLIIGTEAFDRWNQETSTSYLVGVFTFKLLATLVIIGAVGGLIASKFKHNNTVRTLIHLSSTILVMMYIYAIYTIYE